MYDNFNIIEDFVHNKINNSIKVCIYEDSKWVKTSDSYRTRLRNKEKIDEIDENDVLNKINSQNVSEFDDLLEIGE